MKYDLLIVNGMVVTAAGTRRADVAVTGEQIVEIAPDLLRTANRVLDAAGRYVLPGGVDVHTHLDMPVGAITSSDDFETGTRAAAFGGTTTIIDFATQSRGQSLHRAVDDWRRRATGKAVIDYGFHCAITDVNGSVLAEMDDLVDHGITSFKVFMAYPGRLMLSDDEILRVFRQSVRNGGLVCVHAENGPAIEALVQDALARGNTEPKYHALTRPPGTEAEATQRAIALAERAGAPVYIVHVTCREALEHVATVRARGLPVFAETCPHYLFLSIDAFDVPGFEGAKYVLTPPLRGRSHQQALWDGLRSGTLQVVSSDHCPFNFHGQKELGRDDFIGVPNGGPGIEHRLNLVFTGGVASGHFDVNRVVDVVSTAPARLFGLYPKKGTIAVGSDADLVIFDPRAEHTISAQSHHMRVDYSMYEGLRVQGSAEVVISRGEVIVDGGVFCGRPARGRFLQRRLGVVEPAKPPRGASLRV